MKVIEKTDKETRQPNPGEIYKTLEGDYYLCIHPEEGKNVIGNGFCHYGVSLNDAEIRGGYTNVEIINGSFVEE